MDKGWKLLGCLLVFFLSLHMAAGVSQGMALEGEWKYYAPDSVQDDELKLINLHAALRYEDELWHPLSPHQKAPTLAGQRYIWLTTRLPMVVYYKNPVLFFSTTEEAVRVYMDNELIYSYGEFGRYQQTYGKKMAYCDPAVELQGTSAELPALYGSPGQAGAAGYDIPG